MFQPPNTPLSIVESLNDYIDWSDEDIDFDFNDDSDHEPKQKTISRVLSAVADIATKVFLRPWPNITFSSNLISKRYFFNIFNIERHFGYFHEARNDTWIPLDKSGYSYYSEDDSFAQFSDSDLFDIKFEENVIAVQYLT